MTHSDLWWHAWTNWEFQDWVLDELDDVESASCGPLDSPVDRKKNH